MRVAFGLNDSQQQFESSLVYFSIARSGVSKAHLQVGQDNPISVVVRSNRRTDNIRVLKSALKASKYCLGWSALGHHLVTQLTKE